jgi:hypothetical protein
MAQYKNIKYKSLDTKCDCQQISQYKIVVEEHDKIILIFRYMHNFFLSENLNVKVDRFASL